MSVNLGPLESQVPEPLVSRAEEASLPIGSKLMNFSASLDVRRTCSFNEGCGVEGGGEGPRGRVGWEREGVKRHSDVSRWNRGFVFYLKKPADIILGGRAAFLGL